MKKILAVLLTAIACFLPAAADVYEYEPGPFDKVYVRGDLNVVYRNNPDSTGFIRYDADFDFSTKFDVSCNKGKLQIIVRHMEKSSEKLPTLYLYSDYLVGAVNEGNGVMDIEMNLATPTLSLKQIGNGKVICEGVNTTELTANLETGNGTIVARGKARYAKYVLTGSGLIQADELTATEVNCTTLGTGTIGCHAVEALDVRGLGTTKIYYYGNPTVKKVGGAKLEPMTVDSVKTTNSDDEEEEED